MADVDPNAAAFAQQAIANALAIAKAAGDAKSAGQDVGAAVQKAAADGNAKIAAIKAQGVVANAQVVAAIATNAGLGGPVDVGGTPPAKWIYTVPGTNTFFAPFKGELSTLPPDAQFDLLTYWIAQKFNPPEPNAGHSGSPQYPGAGDSPGHWVNFVFGACWDQQGSAVSQRSGGKCGSRDQQVTIALLSTYGDVSGDNNGTLWNDPTFQAKVSADVAQYDPGVLSKSTRGCFVEGYGYRFLHPGVSVGQVLGDIGLGLGAVAAAVGAIFTGGATIAAYSAIAVGAAKTVGTVIGQASANGAQIPDDLKQNAQVFAGMSAAGAFNPPPPPPGPDPVGSSLVAGLKAHKGLVVIGAFSLLTLALVGVAYAVTPARQKPFGLLPAHVP